MARARKMAVTTPERPVFDTRSGEVDIWPILAGDPAELAAEIAKGDHDGWLSLLGHMDKSQGERAEVQAAVRKRLDL